MAAVVASGVSVHRDHPADMQTGKIARRSVRKPRPSRMRGVSKLMLPILVVAVLFGYVSINANLTSTSYNRNELVSKCRMERIKNQRLKVELMRLTSPQYVLAGAEKAHMIPASHYDYLNMPETVAKASRQAE